ncbi:MAG: hypothetical protein HYU98_01975, partial [Deltaproteobacteria bacterium]|nr:hypothetical protein [Deltaproteobacteria bacterium]
MFANYQYGAIQRKNNLKERIRYNSQMSQIDSNEIVSSMMLNQENAILLYLNKIKSRDELEFIEVLGSEAYEAEISGYKCMWGELLDQNACVIKNGNSCNFY